MRWSERREENFHVFPQVDDHNFNTQFPRDDEFP